MLDPGVDEHASIIPNTRRRRMAKELYTAHAHVVGGREDGHGKAEGSGLEVDIRSPVDGGGTNPEELFAIGYGACFDGALAAVARRQKVEVGKVEMDSHVTLQTTEDRAFEIKVKMDVRIDGVDDEQAVELVRTAHVVCPYSRATRGNVEVTLTANGQAVDA
jgi:Ohr subfamily peroxiredoxin